MPVAFLGCISTDRHGRLLRGVLETDGVDTSLVMTTDAPTTVAIADLDDRGGATYRFETAGTAAPLLDAAAVGAALASIPEALHVGTLGLVLEPMASALAAAVATAAPETLVMVDPNVRPAAIDDRTGVPRAPVPHPWSRRRGQGQPRGSRVALAIAARRCRDPSVRRGRCPRGDRHRRRSSGPLSRTASVAFEMPVPEVAVVDTVGAGDAFGGGFLARWMELGLGREGLDDEVALRDALRMAIAVAGRTCTRQGADPPWRSELA